MYKEKKIIYETHGALLDKYKSATRNIKVCEEYIYELAEYEKQYGYNTILFKQVGDFYELYGGLMEDGTDLNYSKLVEVCQMCNISYGIKKSVQFFNQDNHTMYMAGFPLYVLDKFLNIIVDTYEWNCAVINQVFSNNATREVKRDLVGIYTPGTNITCNSESNILVNIFLENQKSRLSKSGHVIYGGISHMDCLTGASSVKDLYYGSQELNICIDEIRKYICVLNPKEISVYYIDMDDLMEVNDFIDMLGVKDKCSHVYRELPDKAYEKIAYQEEFLLKIFKDNIKTHVFEYLGLHNNVSARLSYILLLNFIWNRMPHITDHLNPPSIVLNNKYLILANDSLDQLNIINDSFVKRNQMSLLGLLNTCCTSIGRRLFRERLLNPIRDPVVLDNRYVTIDLFMCRDNTGTPSKIIINAFKQELNNILDIERYHRKIGMNNIVPSELSNMYNSYLGIKNLMELFNSKKMKRLGYLLPGLNDIKMFNDFLADFTSIFKVGMLNNVGSVNDLESSPFVLGKYPEIDEVQKNYDIDYDIINEVKNVLIKFITSSDEYKDKSRKGLKKGSVDNIIHSDYNEKYKHYLYISPSNLKTLQPLLQNEKCKFKIGKYDIVGSKIEFETINATKIRIKVDCIDKSSLNLLATTMLLRSKIRKYYYETVDMIYKKYNSMFTQMVDFIGNVDYFNSCAQTAIDNNYTQPIIDMEPNDSYLDVKQIRHPLIEKINTKIPYVPHDMIMGKDNKNGYLLFGNNASGKSSLMKALGLNIIMAQSGMYVAAKNFTYRPYNYLFTRILGNDNIYKGKSSFEVEMSELKTIMDHADNKSIVLGDELCKGTETISGTAIVSAGIIELSKRNSSFIFATHLHNLNDITQLKELNNVKFIHMTVKYDATTNKLIYDRMIKDGSGPSIYGLEVCRALSLDVAFLDTANTIRKQIMNQADHIVNLKPSNYNANVYQDMCQLCGAPREHIHHIKFQSSADKNKMIDEISAHKNIEHNQVALCEDCHHKVHEGKINIKGYLMTSNGRELDYSII